MKGLWIAIISTSTASYRCRFSIKVSEGKRAWFKHSCMHQSLHNFHNLRDTYLSVFCDNLAVQTGSGLWCIVRSKSC